MPPTRYPEGHIVRKGQSLSWPLPKGRADRPIQFLSLLKVPMTYSSKIASVALLSLVMAVPVSAQAPTFQGVAPIAYLKDMSSGAVLYQRDPERQIPPASMAKMMTAYVAFDLLKQGKIKLDQQIIFKPESWEKWHGPAAGSTMFLSPGESVSVENLLHGIVTLSGNDACVALAEGIAGTEDGFAALMNKQAAKLGMKDSHFGTSNGWPDEGRTVTTAKDLTILAERTLADFPEYYKQFYQQKDFTWGKTMGGNAISQPNRNPILGKIAGADGLKTGHTEEAGFGFAGSAVQNGRRLIMVVAGLDTYNGRADESVKLMDWGFKAWATKALFKKNAVVGSVKVQQGSARTINVIAPQDIAVTYPAGDTPSYKMKIIYDGPVKAPFKAGTPVAQLVIDNPATGPQIQPLVAAEDVSEAGFFRRIWNALLSFFGA